MLKNFKYKNSQRNVFDKGSAGVYLKLSIIKTFEAFNFSQLTPKKFTPPIKTMNKWD